MVHRILQLWLLYVHLSIIGVPVLPLFHLRYIQLCTMDLVHLLLRRGECQSAILLAVVVRLALANNSNLKATQSQQQRKQSHTYSSLLSVKTQCYYIPPDQTVARLDIRITSLWTWIVSRLHHISQRYASTEGMVTLLEILSTYCQKKNSRESWEKNWKEFFFVRIAAKDSKNVNTVFLHNNEHPIDEVLVHTGRLFRNVRLPIVHIPLQAEKLSM